jgi:hypothetical protein
MNPRGPRILWALALAFAFVLSIRAVLRGGYIGPDHHQPTDLLLVGSPIFLAYRIEELLPNHFVDTPGSD